MNKVPSYAAAFAWIAALIGIGFSHTGTPRLLAAAEKAAYYGGDSGGATTPDCYTSATSPCPATVGDCADSNCDGSFGLGTCLATAPINVQTQPYYDNASEVAPPTTGRSKTLPEDAITCLMQTKCSGCKVTFVGPDVCKQGAAVAGGGTEGRTPTKPDPASAACPAAPPGD